MTLTPEQLAALPSHWAKESERIARYADPDKPQETKRTRTRALQELLATLADARLKLAEAEGFAEDARLETELTRGQLNAALVRAQEAETRAQALAEALRPFAAYAEEIDANPTSQTIPDTARVAYNPCKIAEGSEPTMGAFRRAKKVLSLGGKEEEDEA